MSIDKETKELLLDIYRLDKTPRYGYSSKDKDRDSFGNFAGKGKRWLNPKEIIRGYFKDKGVDIWEELKNRKTELEDTHNEE